MINYVYYICILNVIRDHLSIQKFLKSFNFGGGPTPSGPPPSGPPPALGVVFGLRPSLVSQAHKPGQYYIHVCINSGAPLNPNFWIRPCI